LVTLTGPGGIGKTRLALQLAADMSRSFLDGVCFVSLGSTSDPQLVAPAIARALRFPETSGHNLLERLIQWLGPRTILLVLDNFEHLLATATIVADLLAAAPLLRVVVTSRSSLRLRGEREFNVPPLEVPNARQLLLAGVELVSAIGQYDAVRLFVRQARDVRPDFELTDENAATIAEICRRLDGLPLAIELAAARIRLLSPTVLLARLDRRLPVLTGGARDLPTRQQTLRSTIAWSYDLLPASEKALFRHLGTFVRGGTIEAIEAVWNEEDVLDGLDSLVAQSLLRQESPDGDEPRFRMLGTIWEFAVEQLIAHGEADAARRRHASFYLDLAERARREWGESHPGERRDRLERDLDNLRAAARWADEAGESALSQRLNDVLGWFDRVLVEAFRGEAALDDYQRRLASARAASDKREEVRSLLGLVQSYYILSLDDQTQTAIVKAKDYFEAGAALAREIGDIPTLIRLLAQSYWFRDALPEYRNQSVANAREAVALSEALGDEELMIEAAMVGWTVFGRAEAERRGEALTQRLLASGDGIRLNRHYFVWMGNHLIWGRYAKTIEIADAATRLAKSLGIPPVQYATIKSIALIGLGRFGDAWQALQHEVADEAHPFGRNNRALGMGSYYSALGAHEQALTIFREAEIQGRQLKRAWMQDFARAGQVLALVHLGRVAEASRIELLLNAPFVGWGQLPDVRTEVALAEGRYDDALALAEERAAVATEHGSVPARLVALEARCRAYLGLGRLAEALALADAALAEACSIGARPRVWRIQAIRFTALTELGREDEAASAASDAAETIQAIAQTVDDVELRRGFLASPDVAAIVRSAQRG
jgi:predicted ATPase